MARSITLTEIPEVVYERLQERAAQFGVSVSELVREELIERTPTEKQMSMREWLAWLDTLEPIDVPPGAVVEALHAGRAERY
jgi:plasmid stability protein